MSFFIYPSIKRIIITFPFYIQSITFFLDYFFNSEIFLICFLQLVFVKCFINFFPFKVISNICQRHSIFNFFNHKNFFRPIWSVTFCKSIHIFWYSNITNNFKFRIFIINFFTRVNICVWFCINRFQFNCAMICTVIFIYYITWFISIDIFWNWSYVFIIFFPSLCVE